MGDWKGMFPREHGAWSLLLTPFAAALLVAGQLNWTVAAAFAAVVAMFVARAPLVTLSRQRWVWRERRPESRQAARWLAGVAVVLAVCGGWLFLSWGRAALWMGAAAAVLAGTAVWMTVRNRQRSVWLQVASSAGLAFSAVAAARAATGQFPLWSWALWGLCAVHGSCGVLVVHARLEEIVSRKRGEAAGGARRVAWAALAASAAVTVVVALWKPWLALGPSLAAAAQAVELARMDLDTPLRSVGLRAMAVSMAHALLLVWAIG